MLNSSLENLLTGRFVRGLLAASLALGVAACSGKDAPVTDPHVDTPTGALDVTVLGLAQSGSAQVSIAGPNNYTGTLTGSGTLGNLADGDYTITASPVTIAGSSYSPAPPVQTIRVAAGTSHSVASITYVITTGALDVEVSGLPAGVSGSVVIAGPSGYSKSISGTSTLVGLMPGDYTVSAQTVQSGNDFFMPPATPVTVSVVPSETPAPAAIAYTRETASLAITVSGVPAGNSAAVTVSGPGGFQSSISSTTTLQELTPGTYSVVAAAVVAGGATYSATAPSQSIDVAVGTAATPASVTYAVSSGALQLGVTGLPNGTTAAISINGPGGFHAAPLSSTTFGNLTPGTYTIASSNVGAGGTSYAAAPPSQAVLVSAGLTPVTASVTYTIVTGALQVTVTGLPPATPAAVTVQGPNSYSASVIATQTLSALLPGAYAVNASNVTVSGTTYAPSATQQNVVVTSGATAPVSVSYTAQVAPPPPPPPPPPGPDLSIDGMYITQVVQSYAGTVPIVAGRDGLLRVFVKASQTLNAQPAVRVRLYSAGVLTNTLTINAPTSSVPTSITEGVLNSSWNTVIPGAWLQPGVSIIADVDPTNALSESDETNNSFPVSGTPVSLDVRTVSTLNVRLVPVVQTANGATGNVSVANKSSFTSMMMQVYPLLTLNSDVHAPYTTSAPVLQSGDGNAAWEQILSEINTLHATEDPSNQYHYYGVVHTTYTSGVAGLGYVPGNAAIGWDYLPSGTEVAAHEIGHNFGRWHAPCGNPSGVDPNYPYAGAADGVYGYDPSTGTLKPPSTVDLMSYCSNPWISDYDYNGVFTYRSSHATSGTAYAGGSVQPSVLVWGRISHGQLVLEPLYDIDARPVLPAHRGSNTLEFFGEQGNRVASLSFDGEMVADAPDPNDQTFAFVMPKSALGGASLGRVRFTSSALGRSVELRAAGGAGQPVIRTPASEPAVTQAGRNAVRVRWSDPSIRGVLVRDARTGEILSFGKGGDAMVTTTSRDVELILSDGVRSERRRLVPQ